MSTTPQATTDLYDREIRAAVEFVKQEFAEEFKQVHELMRKFYMGKITKEFYDSESLKIAKEMGGPRSVRKAVA